MQEAGGSIDLFLSFEKRKKNLNEKERKYLKFPPGPFFINKKLLNINSF